MHSIKSNRLALAGIMLASFVLLTWLYLGCTFSMHSAAPTARTSVSSPARMVRYFPNTALITHENKKVRFYDDLVKGKVVVINLMYTKCEDICPITTWSLLQVQKALGNRIGRDVFLYSITLDPDRDTPEVLKTYAENFGAKKGWYFLTGEFEDIERLRRKLGLYDPDPVIDVDKTQHGGLFIYGNEATGRWAAIPGFAKPQSIVKALLKVMTPVLDE